jgi:hypothetical protein
MLLTEIDKGGVIRYSRQNTPREVFNVQVVNASLSQFYYPWLGEVVGSDFFRAWAHRFSKQLKLDTRRFFVYAPWEKMYPGKNPELREYRAWLRKTNPWK